MKTKQKLPENVAPPTINDYPKRPSAANEEDFMASLMNNMDQIEADVNTRPLKRKPRDYLSPPLSPSSSFSTYCHRVSDGDTSSDGLLDNATDPSSDDFYDSSPYKKPQINDGEIESSTHNMSIANVQSDVDDFDDSFIDASMDIDFADFEDPSSESNLVSIKVKHEEMEPLKLDTIINSVPNTLKKKEDTHVNWLDVHASLAVNSEDSLGPLSSTSSTAVHALKISALEEDGSLHFFWLDYLELGGKVYFIGKLKDKTTSSWVSCCVTVKNLQRNLFILPREKQLGA